jgi:phenylalanyl-tRNA synthetase beta chain
MRVPISWLKEYVDIRLPIKELADRMTLAGLEVAAIETIGLPGAPLEWDRDRVLVGEIVEIKPHPDADRLVLAVVNYGGDALETCVTGAPNLFRMWAGADQCSTLCTRRPIVGRMPVTPDQRAPDQSPRCALAPGLPSGQGWATAHRHHLLPADAPAGHPWLIIWDVVLDLDRYNLARCFSIVGIIAKIPR